MGLFAALKASGATVLGMGRTRLELFGNELQTEKLRLLRQLVLVLAALVSAAFGILLMVLFATLLFWDQRLLVAGVFMLVFFALALWFYRAFRRSTVQGQAVFASSLNELEKDITQLKQMLAKQGKTP